MEIKFARRINEAVSDVSFLQMTDTVQAACNLSDFTGEESVTKKRLTQRFTRLECCPDFCSFSSFFSFLIFENGMKSSILQSTTELDSFSQRPAALFIVKSLQKADIISVGKDLWAANACSFQILFSRINNLCIDEFCRHHNIFSFLAHQHLSVFYGYIMMFHRCYYWIFHVTHYPILLS